MEENGTLAVPTSVKDRRKARKWTQADLGERVGLSTTAIHNLEAGKNGFTDKTLAALATALECRPADLLLPLNADEVSPDNPESRLRSALLSYGVDRSDLGRAVSAVNLFAQSLREQPEPALLDDQSSSSSRRRAKAPSE